MSRPPHRWHLRCWAAAPLCCRNLCRCPRAGALSTGPGTPLRKGSCGGRAHRWTDALPEPDDCCESSEAESSARPGAAPPPPPTPSSLPDSHSAGAAAAAATCAASGLLVSAAEPARRGRAHTQASLRHWHATAGTSKQSGTSLRGATQPWHYDICGKRAGGLACSSAGSASGALSTRQQQVQSRAGQLMP
jgi:hypothetical protein